MHGKPPEGAALATRLQLLTERLADLEGHVRALVESPTVEAQEVVLCDARHAIRARLDVRDHAPRLTFYDAAGRAHLVVGLRPDGAPSMLADHAELLPRRDETER